MRLLAIIGVLAILGAIFAAAFFFGGFFNVAASEDDPDIVNWALEHVRAASIARHANVAPTGSLDDPALVQAGAQGLLRARLRALSRRAGCGMVQILGRSQSGPPDLKDVVDDLPRRRRLFWVIKNGIKMTGMPSFGKIEVPDPEIWTHCGVLEEAADGIGRRLQNMEHSGTLTGAAARSHHNSETGKDGSDACRIGRIVIHLSSGLEVAFSPHDAPGLRSATPADSHDN